MAKSTSEGTTKRTREETKVRHAPERRRATAKKAGTKTLAPDMAGGRAVASGAPTAGRAPSSEQIAKLAYELYVQRGGVNGYHLEDWYEAERRLRGRA
jgi:hypothetical protein